MGVYEEEQRKIAEGTGKRGDAVLAYFEELDANLVDENGFMAETSRQTHRPNYTRTLFSEEHDDIYRELCAYIDQPAPRYFDTIEDPISVDGYTAADVYRIMKGSNSRIVDLDGAAVYNMLIRLRTQPEIARKVLDFRPTCYQGGCNSKDAAYIKGLYDWQQEK